MLPVVIIDGVFVVYEYLSPLYAYLIVEFFPETEAAETYSEAHHIIVNSLMYIITCKERMKF